MGEKMLKTQIFDHGRDDLSHAAVDMRLGNQVRENFGHGPGSSGNKKSGARPDGMFRWLPVVDAGGPLLMGYIGPLVPLRKGAVACAHNSGVSDCNLARHASEKHSESARTAARQQFPYCPNCPGCIAPGSVRWMREIVKGVEMQVETTAIPGVLIITPRRFGDARGFFASMYHT